MDQYQPKAFGYTHGGIIQATMTPGLRKFALSVHITSSVGWLGAVTGFAVLAVAGLTSRDPQLVQASYLAMELIASCVIVPLSLASPLTGLIQSLGTTWGLFRHYWIVAKLLITIPATILLLVHLRPIGHLARVVAATTLSSGELNGMRIQLIADAGAAVLALLVVTALSVYKPRGMTPYGQRTRGELPLDLQTIKTPRWVYLSGIVVLALVLLFVLQHLSGRGHGGHMP